MSKQTPLYTAKLAKGLRNYWRSHLLHKVLIVFICLVAVAVGSMYGIAQWYINSEKSKPLQLGVSFIPDYAESLGVGPHDTLNALLGDMRVKHLRLVSYWSDIEQNPGQYNWSELDWEFAQAEAHGAKVSLSIGLRQPRWPECHAPSWVDTNKPTADWQPQLEDFMTKVIQRYQHSPALENYELENEYFLSAFGTCSNYSYSRDRLVSEFNLVKKLDTRHPVIISRSNNAQGIPINQPTPDEYGISIYKRVWSPPVGRYVEYPFPAWYYGFLAGVQKLHDGRDMIIHELQAEPWPPHGQSITQTSLAEQNKSLSPQLLADRIKYGEATGMRNIDLWGAEYWYYRMTVLHDPSVWNTAKAAFSRQ